MGQVESDKVARAPLVDVVLAATGVSSSFCELCPDKLVAWVDEWHSAGEDAAAAAAAAAAGDRVGAKRP